MSIVRSPLYEWSRYEEVKKHLEQKKGVMQISGCIDSSKGYLINALSEEKVGLVVTFGEQRAKELVEEIKVFERNVWYYPAKDVLFYQADIRGNLLTSQRLSVLKALREKKAKMIVTTFDALMDRLVNPEDMFESVLAFSINETIELESIKQKLILMGYEKNYQVESPGEFAIRGGILDIYPLSEESPVRIELWGDLIDSIRSFDKESQRSIENLSEVAIYPATEVILTKERMEKGLQRIEEEGNKIQGVLREKMQTQEAYRVKSMLEELREGLQTGTNLVAAESFLTYFYDKTATFLDYYNKEETILFLDEPARALASGRAVMSEYTQSMQSRLEKGYVISGQMNAMVSLEEVISKIESFCTLALTTLELRMDELKVLSTQNLSVRTISAYNKSFELLVKDLKQYKKRGFKVVLLSSSRSRAMRLSKDLFDEGLQAFYAENFDRPMQAGELMVAYGKLKRGFELSNLSFAMIAESDLFGQEHKKRTKKHQYDGERIHDFAQLKVGDYVVHENHGLGVYRGIEKVEVDKVTKDYIKIEYDKGGALYMQASNLELLQKYAGADAKKPKLNRLGGQEWNKTKTRVRSAVSDIAKELVELYATRQNIDGYQYSKDTVWQREFEEMFPFEETDDQMTAIEATKRDMESHKTMDRLICGDVGFGKTEIAIRAAFKAVQDSKQVVYLVPTTILAQQHYNTFVHRMKDFPIKVGLLCRFATPAQQKKTIEGLKKGEIDIVIGTHRLLSKDVAFKDLGLLIIDEEQRFGVAHKEKIKQLKNQIDVLTLTATPIPRTLHMSLVGIRDMSVLEEAPIDRMPIQTYVMEYNEEMVKEAIMRELARNGQVYYVYNRVKQIAEVAREIEALVPEANVAYAHGQMKEHELENIMYQFINGEIDVLVSTTIIETGLDISNVNTMIVQDADNMGLSQLYQLRGRVGRSNRTSYAFLMYRRDKLLKEVAEKRLHAIKEFTELGSGIKIAMKDLEIRGAGNILGADQHGHMEAVGYDLYCKMLNEAIKVMKGIPVKESFETSIDISVDAYIPPTYIPNEFQKLDMYKRIGNIENDEDKDEILEEFIDRFGNPPKAVLTLLDVALLKARAKSLDFTEVSQKMGMITFRLYEKARIDVTKIPELLESFGGAMMFVTKNTPPYFVYKLEHNTRTKEKNPMQVVNMVLDEFAKCLLDSSKEKN